jgi:hypothetical protein
MLSNGVSILVHSSLTHFPKCEKSMRHEQALRATSAIVDLAKSVVISAGLVVLLCFAATTATNAQTSCEAAASAPWPAAGKGIEIEATTLGPNCAQAVAVLVIRNGNGDVVYQKAFAAKFLLVMSDVTSDDEMKPALANWVDVTFGLSKTGQMPDWPEGADQPEFVEFPFYPAEGIDRSSYLDWQRKNAAMFCYVHGMESSMCVAAESLGEGNITISEIGLQSFPG